MNMLDLGRKMEMGVNKYQRGQVRQTSTSSKKRNG